MNPVTLMWIGGGMTVGGIILATIFFISFAVNGAKMKGMPLKSFSGYALSGMIAGLGGLGFVGGVIWYVIANFDSIVAHFK